MDATRHRGRARRLAILRSIAVVALALVALAQAAPALADDDGVVIIIDAGGGTAKCSADGGEGGDADPIFGVGEGGDGGNGGLCGAYAGGGKVGVGPVINNPIEVSDDAGSSGPSRTETGGDDAFVAGGAAVTLVQLLPTADQLPLGLVLVDEGGRSADEITGGFPDPTDAALRFEEWGWQENQYRTFEVAGGAGDPTATSLLDVSAHRFRDGSASAAALEYFAEARQEVFGLEEFEVGVQGTAQVEAEVEAGGVVAIVETDDQVAVAGGEAQVAVAGGEAAPLVVALGGPVPDGNEVTVYLQRGADVVRVTAVSPAGDPSAVAVAVAVAILTN